MQKTKEKRNNRRHLHLYIYESTYNELEIRKLDYSFLNLKLYSTPFYSVSVDQPYKHTDVNGSRRIGECAGYYRNRWRDWHINGVPMCPQFLISNQSVVSKLIE